MGEHSDEKYSKRKKIKYDSGGHVLDITLWASPQTS